MTDFYALLKQSIFDRGLRGENERREMYAQARRAVIKQLWDYRPPLAADEIDMRVGTYDTAVERIEADMQAAIANGEIAWPKPPPVEPATITKRSTVPRAVRAAVPSATRQTRHARSLEPAAALPVGRTAAASPVRATPAGGAVRGNTALAAVGRLASPAPQYYDEPDDEELLDEEYVEEAEAAEAKTQPRSQLRWAKPPRYEGSDRGSRGLDFEWPAWLGGSGQQAAIRIAAIGAGALFILVVAIVSYQLGARSSGGVTLPIGIHREVSDAATAARIPTENAKVLQTFTIFDGVDPTVFATTPDNPIAFDSAGGFARVSSSTSAPGVKVTIGPGVAARLAGQNVRVVIVGRSSHDTGAAGMRFAYQSGLAISHWQTANLGSDYAPVGIQWRLPTMRTSPTGDFLLIEPGIPGDGSGVDIKSIRIDVLAS